MENGLYPPTHNVLTSGVMLANSAGAVGGAYPKYPDPHHAGAIIQRCVCRTPRCFRLLRLERKWKGSYICLAKMVPSPRDLTYSKCPKISEAKFSKLLTYIDSIPIVHWWKKGAISMFVIHRVFLDQPIDGDSWKMTSVFTNHCTHSVAMTWKSKLRRPPPQ